MINSALFWKVLDPGLILIELMILYFVINIISVKKTGRIYTKIQFSIIVVICMIMSIVNILPDIRVLIAIVFSSIFYKRNYNVEIIKCVIIVLVYWLLAISLDTVSIVAVMHLNSLSNLKSVIDSGLYRLEAIILSKSLLFLASYLCKYFKIYGNLTIKDFFYIGIPIITNIFSLFIIFGNGFGDYKTVNMNNYLMFFLAILLLVSNVSLVVITLKIINDNKLILEHQLRSKRNDIEYNYYIKLEENNYKVRRLYHDMKNHLMCIANLCDNEESRNYVNGLDFELNKLDNSFNTGNKVLDIILSEKKTICIEKGINFTTYVDFSKSDFMEMDDICTIFANALDNAIDACDKINISEINKMIDTKVKYTKGFCIIKITNSKVNKVLSKNKKILTDKKNGSFHGMGIINIKDVVKKYCGEVIIDYSENEFILTIMIPIS
ncbi:sensor histidine kinase [Metaclostridioides mangenotii]|uniref:sensor histidine kinase n=1 Tax=Metaclostridioides mangenotii TaxID=1540 RepID=UPI0004636242|nr:sensor histidine kinase [Clostridioides mangenotii]